VFPHPSHAEPDGLLGLGGDLSPKRLLLAYRHGIFPWYSEGQPILWFSPDPRFVLEPDRLHVGRSLAKRVRKRGYEVKMDSNFRAVVGRCREIPRPRQRGTWITQDMRAAYIQLYEMGFAHSVETYLDGVLVGGLYGVTLGGLFAGESMFACAPDASKVAFVWLAEQLRQWGFGIVDCQVHTQHLERFGAHFISRQHYLERLEALVQMPNRTEKWEFDEGFFPRLDGGSVGGS